MTRVMVEVPAQVPAGVVVEFFADQACTEAASMSLTGTSRSPGSWLRMPRTTLPALYGPPGARDVFARWTEPTADLSGGAVGERTRVVRCRKVAVPVVSGRW